MHTTNEENKVLARRFEQALNTRQFNVLNELFAPNMVRHCQATPEVDVRSLEQFKDFLRQDLAVFPDSISTFTHLLAEGDLVAVWATYEGTQRGQMGPFPPSGKKVQFDYGGYPPCGEWQVRGVVGDVGQHGGTRPAGAPPGPFKQKWVETV